METPIFVTKFPSLDRPVQTFMSSGDAQFGYSIYHQLKEGRPAFPILLIRSVCSLFIYHIFSLATLEEQPDPTSSQPMINQQRVEDSFDTGLVSYYWAFYMREHGSFV